MSNSNNLFAFFKLLHEEHNFFGQYISLGSKDYEHLLQVYDPWEWSEELQSAPVDYLLGVGLNHYEKPQKLKDEIWGVFEMCLKHPHAPPPETWSSRLSCMTEGDNTLKGYRA